MRTGEQHCATGAGRLWWIGELSGAFGDLGVFLPLVIGLLVVGSFDGTGLLIGFGVFAIATGVIYRRPVPVQPMKAIAALAITGVMTATDVMASSIILGLILLGLGASGMIDRFERLVPRTILLGIQLGLGGSLIVASAKLAGAELWLGVLLLGVLTGFRFAGFHAGGCLAILGGGIAWVLLGGNATLPTGAISLHLPFIEPVSASAFWSAMETGVVPQLALTVTNAVLLTAAISADYFPQDRQRISARHLAMSSGGLNLLLAPLGAVPMCHGAGGLAAQYAQGARTGLAPVIFGTVCLTLGLLAGPNALAWLSLIPIPVIAALLAFAGWQLVDLKRLRLLRPTCLAIIGLTALTSLLINVAAGLVVGCAAEILRSRFLKPGSRPAESR